jgi:hypothetical protein
LGLPQLSGQVWPGLPWPALPLFGPLLGAESGEGKSRDTPGSESHQGAPLHKPSRKSSKRGLGAPQPGQSCPGRRTVRPSRSSQPPLSDDQPPAASRQRPELAGAPFSPRGRTSARVLQHLLLNRDDDQSQEETLTPCTRLPSRKLPPILARTFTFAWSGPLRRRSSPPTQLFPSGELISSEGPPGGHSSLSRKTPGH